MDDPIKARVRKIVEKTLAEKAAGIADGDDIFSRGIDSLATVMLLAELEGEFGVDLSGEQVAYDELRTIERIARMVGAMAPTAARQD